MMAGLLPPAVGRPRLLPPGGLDDRQRWLLSLMGRLAARYAADDLQLSEVVMIATVLADLCDLAGMPAPVEVAALVGA